MKPAAVSESYPAPPALVPDKSASDVLADKGEHVWSIGPDASMLDAVKLMVDKRAGALVVMDGDRLIGIVSERDYARRVILEGRSFDATPVRSVMTASVTTVTPSHALGACMELMTNLRVRHLPVVDGDRVRGMVSIGDVVRILLGQQQHVINELERYVAG